MSDLCVCLHGNQQALCYLIHSPPFAVLRTHVLYCLCITPLAPFCICLLTLASHLLLLLKVLIHRFAVELLRQTEAAALSFASELRETEEKRKETEEREIWWADSSMFKEGVLLGASGRMSGVLEGHIHGTFLALERKRMHTLMSRLRVLWGNSGGREVRRSTCMV